MIDVTCVNAFRFSANPVLMNGADGCAERVSGPGLVMYWQIGPGLAYW